MAKVKHVGNSIVVMPTVDDPRTAGHALEDFIRKARSAYYHRLKAALKTKSWRDDKMRLVWLESETRESRRHIERNGDMYSFDVVEAHIRNFAATACLRELVESMNR